MLDLYLAVRYLLSSNWRSFSRFLTVVSVAGVAIGVWALIVVLSVMNGLRSELTNSFLGFNAHIVVSRDDQVPMTNYRELIREIEAQGDVVAASPVVSGQALMTSEISANGVMIKGIELESALRVSRLGEYIVEGDAALIEKQDGDAPGILIGRELASNLSIWNNERVQLVSPSGELTPAGILPSQSEFQTVGMFRSHVYEYDANYVFTSLAAARKFIGLDDEATSIEVLGRDAADVDSLAATIRSKLGPEYRIETWIQRHTRLFSAMELEKVGMFLVLVLIVLVAAFNIVGALIMVVIDKRHEVAVLRSLGAPRQGVQRSFHYAGILIGILGASVGLQYGLLILGIQERFKILTLPPAYYIDSLPIDIRPLDVAFTVFAALLICFLATLYPARQAASFEPSKILRFRR